MGMAEGVEIVEKGLVLPGEATPPDDIFLSNLDHLVARAHTPTVYFYRRPAEAGAGFFSPALLRETLARALVPFYPLAGRLAAGADGRIRIRCTGDGALFVVARSVSVLDDFGDFSPSDRLRRLLVPSVDVAGDADTPLVMLQLTFFRCGGVCLGAAVHHAAADGLGALHFVNSWANITGGHGIPEAPVLDRTVFRTRSPLSVTSNHVEYSQNPSPAAAAAAERPFESTILKLSKKQLFILKASSSTSNKPLSTFKAVVAYTWRCACVARGLGPENPTRLYMTADARTRLRQPLPASYLGNAIFRTSADASVGELLSNPLCGAAKIDDATKRLDDEFVRSLVDYLEDKVGAAGLRKGSWVMPATDLWVISWLGLPIYEADFGWGKPFYMGRACLQFSGLVYIVPSSPAEEDVGMSLVVALESGNMGRFKEVFYEDLKHVAEDSNL
ncbi:Shikimate O-hydroxycinnamoyltransferase [Apostasia shenzhenica]|uniref:Shikimate O-hydroxycinnamoyltransferase n=1 Tax=Apostasia shenzhenica TaxID=1088818 RepID=A0A2H9ZU22_9ASPA|nr:Shikimate O-hydroxycinnamoyltransferase [Apostasia shenzhenica]